LKPYWGYNEAAKILHFHGPKPVQVEFLAQDVNYPCDAVIRKLYSTDPRSYSEYIADWTKYRKLGERIIGLAPRDAQGAPVTVLPLEFDADSYLLANKDLAVAKVDPLAHYLRHGFREGRRLRE
jgi:hypothetical protein